MTQGHSGPRTREEYIDIVENRYFANVDLRNLAAVLECFHEDAMFTVQSAFSTHEGRDEGIRRMFENLFEEYEPKILHRDFTHVVDSDNCCCATQFEVENTSREGEEVRLSNCNFFYFKGDKISEVYVYMSGGMNTLG